MARQPASMLKPELGLEHERLPFAVGKSPFRIKGSGYLLHMQYVDEHLPGGRAAMLSAIESRELRAFFEQTSSRGTSWTSIPWSRWATPARGSLR
jgi:hypothetical protein